MNVALIGCGRWGRNVARALSGLGALKVVADPQADAISDFVTSLGARVVPRAEEAITADGIEAVAIAAPAGDHARLVLASLAAGKHVFVEKPLATTVDDARDCAGAAKSAGKVLMVGHLLQYHPAFVRLLELVRGGAIGRVRHAASTRLNPGAIRTEENALWSLAPHDFSMLLALCGRKVEAVSALASRIVQTDVDDSFTVSMRFASGVTGRIEASWLSPYKEHKLTVIGETGALVFEDTAADPARKLVLYRDHVAWDESVPRYVKSAGEPVAFPGEEPLRAEMAWFLAACRGEATPKSGPDEAIAVLEALSRAEAARL
jgi:predicted dehydrogenase